MLNPNSALFNKGGRFCATGTSPQEVQDTYVGMMDLVQQVLAYCQKEFWAAADDIGALLERESKLLITQLFVRPAHASCVMAKVRTLLKEAGNPALPGDSSLLSDEEIPIIYVAGNHEFYADTLGAAGSAPVGNRGRECRAGSSDVQLA